MKRDKAAIPRKEDARQLGLKNDKEVNAFDEEAINNIMKFKDGDLEAGAKIIDLYSPLIGQLVGLIKYKSFNAKSYTQRSFLSMFSKSSGMAYILRGRKPTMASIAAAQNTLSFLEGFHKHIDEDDVRQDVIEVLLSTLKKFRLIEGANLSGYINTAFIANLARRVKATTKDPLVNLANDKIIPYCEEYSEDKATLVGFNEVNKIATDGCFFLHEDDELGVNWLIGTTCDDRLASISSYERHLLKLMFHYKMTYREIAAELGMSFVNARKRIRDILDRVRGGGKEIICESCGKDFYLEEKGRIGRKFNKCLECRERKE